MISGAELSTSSWRDYRFYSTVLYPYILWRLVIIFTPWSLCRQVPRACLGAVRIEPRFPRRNTFHISYVYTVILVSSEIKPPNVLMFRNVCSVPIGSWFEVTALPLECTCCCYTLYRLHPPQEVSWSIWGNCELTSFTSATPYFMIVCCQMHIIRAVFL
jgi:hypothetical protein